MLKIWKRSWESFKSWLLNSTVQFLWKWAVLAVLFSRQVPNGSHYLFHIFSIIFFKFLKYPTNHFRPHIFDTYYCKDRWCARMAPHLLTVDFFSTEADFFFFLWAFKEFDCRHRNSSDYSTMYYKESLRM